MDMTQLRQDIMKAQIAAGDYAEFEKGMDPIGASDIIGDFVNLVTNQVIDGTYKSAAESWDPFWERIQPKYFGTGA
jgi:hypothetical protein